jgi:hypothetical protein
MFQQKMDVVCQHIYEAYFGAGQSIYLSVRQIG